MVDTPAMPLSSVFSWLGSAIDWLDQHQGSSAALLSATLVIVTIYYAIQNRKMATEAERARGAAILPKLALDFLRIGPTAVTTAITNVGPGAALDVDVTLSWDPLDGVTAPPPTRWRRNHLLSGEQADFMLGGDDLNDSLNRIPATCSAMRLTGSMKDAAGTVHEVDEVFADLAEWRKLLGNARQRWTDPAPERRLADALHRKFQGRLKSLDESVAATARAVQSLAPPKDRT